MELIISITATATIWIIVFVYIGKQNRKYIKKVYQPKPQKQIKQHSRFSPEVNRLLEMEPN
jgi:hypothetical protein